MLSTELASASQVVSVAEWAVTAEWETCLVDFRLILGLPPSPLESMPEPRTLSEADAFDDEVRIDEICELWVRLIVYQRDRWRCHLCDDAVTSKLVWLPTEVRCATYKEAGVYEDFGAGLEIAQLDHIQPKTRGGADSLENLATACRYCNLLKGNHDNNAEVRRAVTALNAMDNPATVWTAQKVHDLALFHWLSTRRASHTSQNRTLDLERARLMLGTRPLAHTATKENA